MKIKNDERYRTWVWTNQVRTNCSEEERKKVWDPAVKLRNRAGAEKGRE